MWHYHGFFRPFSVFSGSPRPNTRGWMQSAAIVTACVALAAAFSPAARAQGVSFAGSQIVLGSGFNQPYGVAVDASGDVFVTDTYNSQVKELVAVNGIIPANPTINTLGSGFNHPYGIAVDASGDVFIADTVNGQVKEIVAVNGSIPANATVNTLVSGYSNPFGVAVDAKGNVYFASAGNSSVYEIVAVGGVVPAANPTVLTLGSGFNVPYGVAVDPSGDVYVADAYNNAVKEMLAVNGAIPASPTIVTLSSSFNQPQAVALDPAGDLLVFDSNNTIYKISAVGGSIPSNPAVATVGTFNAAPEGLAVDAKGDIFFGNPGQNEIVELQAQSVDFGSVNVCRAGQATPAPCNSTLTLTYNVAAGTTVGSVKILTAGASNQDFQAEAADASATLCSAQSYNAATTCTVDVTFAPVAPGARNGAVQILDGGGNVLATTPIYGVGVSAAIAFTPSPVASLGSGFNKPRGVAVDGTGDVFVADTVNGQLKEIVAGNGVIAANPTIRTLATGSISPNGVAADGAGNVFFVDAGTSTVKEILAVGGSIPASNPIVVTLASGFEFSEPWGVAVDGGGNVYVSDSVANSVYEIPAVAGYATVKTLAGGFNSPEGVAVDAAGDVFVADTVNNAVKEIVAAGGYTTVKTLGGGFSDPVDVAVDAAGDVVVADLGNNAVKEILAPGGYTTVMTLDTVSSPAAVALDAMGDVYIGSVVNPGSILELERSTPLSLTFASTTVGATSSDSPKAVQFQNIGNATLVGNGSLTDYTDFITVPGPGIVPDCNADGETLAAGAECNFSYEFTPQSVGALSSVASLSDNVLNATNATQSFTLSGTGLAIAPTISFTVPNQTYPSAAFTLSASSNSIAPIAYSLVSGPASVSGSTVTLTNTGTVILQASQAAAGIYAAGSKQATFQVTASATPVTVTPVSLSGGYLNVNAIATTGTAPENGGFSSSYAYESSLIGTSLTYQNLAFPLGAANAPDAASSEKIALPAGTYNQLYLVGASSYGPYASQSVVVTYTDGSTSTFTQSFSDWGAPQKYAGETTVLQMASRITPTGATQAGPWYVYGYTFALAAGKTAASVTLPSNRNIVFFGIGLGGNTAVSLTGSSNVYGIVSAGTKPQGGGYDTNGYAYESSLTGASLSYQNVTFPLTANALDAVSNAKVTLPAGTYNQLYLVGSGVNGAQANQKIVVTYTDGTTSTFTQSFSDWGYPQSYTGETTVLSTASRITPTGATQAGPWNVYGYTFTLTAGKTAASVTLPANRNVVFLGIGLGSATAVNLGGPLNVYAIASPGTAPQNGGLNSGYAYDSALIGTSLTYQGSSFPLGAANALDAASNEKIALPAGSYSQLYLLGGSAYGPYTNQTVVVTYTDGTTSTFTQNFSDWGYPQSYAGETKVLQMASRITPTGATQAGPWYVYGYTFNLTAGKTAASVTLPANGNIVFLAVGLGNQ